jgi:hypothetical protein
VKAVGAKMKAVIPQYSQKTRKMKGVEGGLEGGLEGRFVKVAGR